MREGILASAEEEAGAGKKMRTGASAAGENRTASIGRAASSGEDGAKTLRKTGREEKTPFSGVLLLDKPAGITSHDLVGRVRRLYGTREVGHTGTLDPMATGLLVVLVGRAVKASDMLVTDRKRYAAGLFLGITTDTEDIGGTVRTRSENIPAPDKVKAVCQSFVGRGEQIPPMYSALKVGGKKLVDLARQGIEVERVPRPIEIYSLSVAAGKSPCEYNLDVVSSKGTYIRTLCADIGKALGCGGVMSSLRRLASGSFSLDRAVTPEALEQMTPEERIALLLPVEEVFASYPALRLPAFYERLARNGCEIYQEKIGSAYAVGTRLRLYGESGFYAVAEVFSYPAGSAVKIIKRFG